MVVKGECLIACLVDILRFHFVLSDGSRQRLIKQHRLYVGSDKLLVTMMYASKQSRCLKETKRRWGFTDRQLDGCLCLSMLLSPNYSSDWL